MTEVLLKNIDPIVIKELQKIAVVNNRTLEEEIANILQIFTEKRQFNQAWDNYDCVYFSLAVQNNYQMVTADERFLNA